MVLTDRSYKRKTDYFNILIFEKMNKAQVVMLLPLVMAYEVGSSENGIWTGYDWQN
jgi:hypothetical protein